MILLRIINIERHKSYKVRLLKHLKTSKHLYTRIFNSTTIKNIINGIEVIKNFALKSLFLLY